MNVRIKHRGLRPIAAAWAALAVGSLGSQVCAASSGSITGNPSVVVRYDDLDIQSMNDKDVLLRRISRATERVCGPITRELRARRAYDQCRRESLKNALAQVERNRVGAAAGDDAA